MVCYTNILAIARQLIGCGWFLGERDKEAYGVVSNVESQGKYRIKITVMGEDDIRTSFTWRLPAKFHTALFETMSMLA